MNYKEEMSLTDLHKEEYVQGFKCLIDKLQADAAVTRAAYAAKIISDPEPCREDLKRMLGWPLVNYQAEGLPAVRKELLAEEDGYKIYRVRFEVLAGLWLTGLLFKRDGKGTKPLVLVQHGKEGTPELISGIYGKTYNYNDMLHRVCRRDVHVFAPQLLLWSDEYNVAYDRTGVDSALRRVGSSVTAVEVFGLMRILDYFEQQDYVSNFGMVGLSYGGFYTLYTAAIDTRIKSAISCSFFNKRDVIDWSDWCWFDAAKRFDDAEVACLVYPRKLYIEMGDNDDLFDWRYSEESFHKIETLCESVGTDWVDLKIFGGTHELWLEDTHIDKLIKDIT